MARAKQSPEPNRQEQDERSGERRQELTGRRQYSPSMWSGGPGPLGPLRLINRFASEMERMFEDLGFGRGLLTPRSWGEAGREREGMIQGAWSPQIEAFEREGQFILRADLPGMTKDDVKVSITDDDVVIQGERKQEHEEEREGWHRSERSYGSFFRRIPLPPGVNGEQADASFRDGVLEIKMPAPPREERRQIEIR